MNIKQSVKNTFDRVGIDYNSLENQTELVNVENRFGYGSCEVLPLVAKCIDWVYRTSNDYESGIQKVNLSDFDRVRYFVLEVDSNAYSVCLD